MSLLINSLNNISTHLKKNGSDVILQPGLSYTEIEEKVASLPFCLPKELYELYQWRNGTPEYSDCKCFDFFLCYRFLPLEESLQIVSNFIKTDSWIIDEVFPYGWFPIFTFEGEYYSVIGAEKQRDFSPIMHIYHDETVDYVSLTAMMQTIAECYQTETYYINDKGYYESRQNEEEKIVL